MPKIPIRGVEKRCRFPRAVCIIVIAAGFGWGESMLGQEPVLAGQLRDASTLLPLEGAKVLLDLMPIDGTPEFELATDPFGLYELTEVPTGSYEVTARRGGYATETRTTLITGGALFENFDLAPIGGYTPVDLYLEVRDASSLWQIPEIPVSIVRYDSPSGGIGDAPLAGVTNAEGSIIFYGAQSGYYTFHFNTGGSRRPGWEAYPKTGSATPRAFVSQAHMASLELKHEPQTIKLNVTGCDPKTEVVGPLENVFVELAGVRPDDHDIVMVPARAAPTDEMGNVTFFNLAPLHWRVRTRRLGFESAEVFLTPDTGTDDLPGKQPGAAEPIGVTLSPTALKLSLDSIYPTEEYYEGIEVVLEGITDSNTEGISRTLDSGDTPGDRLFEKLLPGRYVVRVNDHFEPSDPDTMPAPHFIAEDSVEVLDSETTELALTLNVRPAVIRTRLFVANTLGDMRTGGGDDLVLRRPIYEPTEVPDFGIGDGVGVTAQPTDVNGEATFVVYPGLYGFSVPSLTGYYGSHMVVQRDGEELPGRFGWPSLSGSSVPTPLGGASGSQLVVHSDREYRIELFAHPKVASFYLNMVIGSENPTGEIVEGIPASGYPPQCAPFFELGAIPASFTLSGSGGSIAGVIIRRGPSTVVEFDGVTPGTWTWSGSHPNYDIDPLEFIPGVATETFTVPDWPTHPGADYPPSGPPPFSFFHDPIALYQPWPGFSPAEAKYKSTGAVTLDRKVWDEEADPPEYIDAGTDTDPTFEYIMPAYAGGALFCAAKRPKGAFEFWKLDSSGNWFYEAVPGDGAETFTIYVGGPMNNVFPSPPTKSGTLTLKAVARQAPDVEIPGVSFLMAGGGSLPTGTVAMPSGYSGAVDIGGATDPSGKWLYVGKNIVHSGAFNTEVTIVAEMARALTVSGTVKVDNVSAEPIPKAKVRMYDRFGDPRFPGIQTEDDGSFTLPPTLETPVFFMEVRAPGFKPKRIRYAPDSPEITGGSSGVLALDIRLEPLPAPTVTATIDRYGFFLSYLSSSGSGDYTDWGQATTPLTAHWEATVTPPASPATWDEPQFDNPDGSVGPSVNRTLEDQIALVAIVDPRLFPPDISNAAGNGAPGSPVAGSFAFLPDPDPAKVLARRAWWDSVSAEEFEDENEAPLPGYSVLWQLASSMIVAPSTGVVTATGTERLWRIPPGKYTPVIVVETQHGALSFFTIEYSGPEEGKTLRSLRLPPWLSALAELSAVTQRYAGSPLLQQRTGDSFLSGRFKPKRMTTGTIDLGTAINGDEGYLNYNYEISVVWNEGQEGPGAGLTSFMTDTIGGSLEVNFGVKAKGKDGSLTYMVEGQATTESVDTDLFKPKNFSPAQKRRRQDKRVFTGGASLASTQAFDADLFPLDSVLQTRLIFGASVESRYNLKPYIKLVPYVGPVVRTIDRVSGKQLTMDAVAKVAVGLDSVSTWSTRYPRIIDSGGSGVPGAFPHPERGHFMGGLESHSAGSPITTFDQNFNICMRTALGVEVALGKYAGGSMTFALQGNECEIPIAESVELPAMRFEINTESLWPPIRKVSGAVSVTAVLFLDVYLTKFQKKYELLNQPFSFQLGTQSNFTLTPFGISYTVENLPDEPQSTFLGSSPQLIQGLLGSSTVSVGGKSGSGDMMVYADVNPTTGRMVLKAAPRTTATTWGPPVSIGEDDGITAAGIAELSGGTLLAVWAAVADADLGVPGAPSTLRYSTSADGGATWAPVATAATLPRLAEEVKLVVAGTTNALIVRMSEGVPGSNLSSLHGLIYTSGTGWSPTTTLVASAEILDQDAAAVGSDVVLAWVDASDALKALTWSGASPSAIATAAGPFLPYVTVSDTGSGFSLVGAAPQSGGVQFHLLAGGTLVPSAAAFTDEVPADLDSTLIDGSPSRVFTAWSDSEDGGLRGALFDVSGAAFSTEPLDISRSYVGRYKIAEILPAPAGHGTILARFDAPDRLPELRQFVVTDGGALAFTDRDADILNDRDELRIVDADAFDAISTIDQVLATDDFDLDGSNNGDELGAGTDPTNPNDFPVPMGVTIVALVNVAQEFGLTPAYVQISRSDDTTAVDVLYSISGSATPGTDFLISEASPVHFAVGESIKTLTVYPLSDSEAEGEETIDITLTPDVAYTLGAATVANVTLRDRPSDAWKVVHFPANPTAVDLLGDTDLDGTKELAEFGLLMDPNVPDSSGLPTAGLTADGVYPTITYTRPEDADVSYLVQFSTNLAAWFSGPGYTEEISRIHNGDGSITVTVRSAMPLSTATSQQLRLRIRRF